MDIPRSYLFFWSRNRLYALFLSFDSVFDPVDPVPDPVDPVLEPIEPVGPIEPVFEPVSACRPSETWLQRATSNEAVTDACRSRQA